MGDYVGDPTPQAQNKKVYVKGDRLGVGEMFNPSVLFFFFSFLFGSLNGPPAYPVRIGWALSASKNVFWC